MATNDLIFTEDFCHYHQIEPTLMFSLHESGLIELTEIENKTYIHEEQLPQLEQLVHFHELGINVEGMETITHLLHRINEMHREMCLLSNKLSTLIDMHGHQ
jgi:hypothetical protein